MNSQHVVNQLIRYNTRTYIPVKIMGIPRSHSDIYFNYSDEEMNLKLYMVLIK